MIKRIICMAIAIMMAIAALSGCGKKYKIDHFLEGYDAVKEKRYEDALESFRIAAADGDNQAATAAKIIEGYFNALEAFHLGEIDDAKEFLEKIPENYKYYAIGEDIDALRRDVYSGNVVPLPTESAGPEEEKADEEKEEKGTEAILENEQPTEASVNDLSPEKAVEYLQAAYPEVQGDVSGALAAQYDENDNIYYELTIQLGEDIKTLRILADGTIIEV